MVNVCEVSPSACVDVKMNTFSTRGRVTPGVVSKGGFGCALYFVANRVVVLDYVFAAAERMYLLIANHLKCHHISSIMLKKLSEVGRSFLNDHER